MCTPFYSYFFRKPLFDITEISRKNHLYFNQIYGSWNDILCANLCDNIIKELNGRELDAHGPVSGEIYDKKYDHNRCIVGKKISEKIYKFLLLKDHKFFIKYSPDYSEFVHYPVGSYLETHTDIEDGSKYTCILYLNDDYNGGNTYLEFESTKIDVPKNKGSCFCFKGDKVKHGSRPITSGNKYVILMGLFKRTH